MQLLHIIASVLLLSLARHCQSQDQKHIVIFVADDLGWNDVGWHNPAMHTPYLDEIAAGGLILENYYAAPICSPSRAQMMSGRLALSLGIQGVVAINTLTGLPLQVPTMAEALKGAGYATHVVGKWHLGMYEPRYFPTNRGFDSFFGAYAGAAYHYTHKKCVTFGAEEYCGLDLYDNADIVYGNTEYSALLQARKAVEVVEAHDPSQPLFLYLPFNVPHSPLEVPSEYLDLYPEEENTDRKIYSAMVSVMDEAIGNVTQAFKDQGMWDDTLMVFYSDNGGVTGMGAKNEPLRGQKGELWEGGCRVPAVVHGAGDQTAGSVSNELMHVTDWFPTFAHLAGSDIDTSDMYGINMWDMLSAGVSGIRQEAILGIDDTSDTRERPSSTMTPHAAIVRGQWKLVTGFLTGHTRNDDGTYTFPNTLVRELYDLSADMSETTDLSADHPDIVNALLQRLAEVNEGRAPLMDSCTDFRSCPVFHNMTWAPWIEEGADPDRAYGCSTTVAEALPYFEQYGEFPPSSSADGEPQESKDTDD